MSDAPRPPDDNDWVVEPAQAVEVHVAVGADAELTPEVRAALDELIRVLEEEANQEVEAFRKCIGQCKPPGYGTCNPQDTTCTPKVWFPCYSKMICSVIDDS